jgi:hypothetical protein
MSIEIIKAFSGQKTIVIYPVYLDITGDYATAAALSQVLYWHNVMNGKFYKTDSDFEQELHLTPKQFRRVKTALKTLSFLKITVEQNPSKTFYDVDYTAMTALIKQLKPPAQKGEPRPAQKGEPRPAQKGEPRPAQKGEPRPAQKGEPLYTETTTEITKDYNNTPEPQAAAPITQTLVVGLTERQKEKASEQLAQLSPDQQGIAIQSFNKKMVSGEMKSPMAYLNVLVEKGLKNGLEAAGMTKSIQTLTPTPKIPEIDHKAREKLRLECIKAFVANKKDDLLKEFAEHGFVTSRGMGMIIEPDLKAAGLFD